MSAVAPVVVVTLPEGVAQGTQVAVHHYEWGVEVDVRHDPRETWTPVALAGGSFEVRS